MELKEEIKITYLVTLDTDDIWEALEDGSTVEDIMVDLKKYGIHDGLVMDYEVDEVEAIEK